jgi:hypothetical protein
MPLEILPDADARDVPFLGTDYSTSAAVFPGMMRQPQEKRTIRGDSAGERSRKKLPELNRAKKREARWNGPPRIKQNQQR